MYGCSEIDEFGQCQLWVEISQSVLPELTYADATVILGGVLSVFATAAIFRWLRMFIWR